MKDHELRQDPRHRVLYDPGEASLEDLIAVLLSSGTAQRGVMEVSADIVRKAKNVAGLAGMNASVLLKMDGVGRARASRLLAARELACRLADARSTDPPRDLRLEDLPDWLLWNLRGRDREYFYQFNFDAAGRLIERRLLARGALDEVQIFFRDAIACAVQDRATLSVIAHNHPWADCRPSREDLEALRSLRQAFWQVGVQLGDQYIVGENGVFSCLRGCLAARPGASRAGARQAASPGEAGEAIERGRREELAP